MKRITLLILMMILTCSILGTTGCSLVVPKVTTVKTEYKTDGTKIVTKTKGAPDAMSDEVAKMVAACYESFDIKEQKRHDLLATMDSEDRAWAMTFDRYSETVLAMQGIDSRQVCSSPTNIYDYAIVHDKELYATVRSGIKDVTGLGPWAAVSVIGAAGSKNAGDEVEGDKYTAGRDLMQAGGNQTISGNINRYRQVKSTRVAVGESTITGDMKPEMNEDNHTDNSQGD